MRELRRDALVYLPARVVPAVMAAVAIPVFSRLLDPDQYGRYTLALNTAVILYSISAHWLTSAALRFWTLHRERGFPLYFLRALPLASALAVGGYVASGLLRTGFTQPVMLGAGALLVLGTAGFESTSAVFRARSEARWYVGAVIWRSVAGFIAGVWLCGMSDDRASGVVFGMALAALVAVPLMVGRIARGEARLSMPVGAGLGRDVLQYGVPAAFVAAGTACLSYASRFVIEHTNGLAEVGIYAANYDIAEKSIFFLNSTFLLSSSVLGFRKFDEGGSAAGREFLADLMRFYLLVALLPAALLIGLAQPVVEWLLPAPYWRGWPVVEIVTVSALLIGVLHRYSLLLSFHKRNDLILYATLGALALNLALSILVAPRYGIIGVAASGLAGNALYLLAVVALSRRYDPPPFPWRYCMRACAVAAAAGMVARLCLPWLDAPRWLALAAAATAGSLTYAAGMGWGAGFRRTA
jgi:O-antigen/teichoic acid export membrane protein